MECGDAIVHGTFSESRLVSIARLADLAAIIRQPAKTAPAIATNDTAAILLVRVLVCVAVPSCVGGGVFTVGCAGGRLA